MIRNFDKQIFVVGSGRCGTSLVQAMLNAHSAVFSPPEFHFWRNYICKPGRQYLNQIDHLGALADILKQDAKISRLQIDADRIPAYFNEHRAGYSLVEVYKLYMTLYASAFCPDKSIFADGTPNNIFYIDQIRACYPAAFFIYMLRDPRDVILSRMKADFNTKFKVSVENMAVNFMDIFEIGLRKETDIPGRFMYMFYEDLIKHPEAEIRKLCAFTGINYEPSMLEYRKNAGEVFGKDEAQWKSNLMKPVLSENFNKWKKDLSEKDVMIIEWVCRRFFRMFPDYMRSGYEKKISLSAYISLVAPCYLREIKRSIRKKLFS